jgi:Tfp pilus assembly protein PilF
VRTIRELTEDAFAQHIAGNRDAAADMYDKLLGFTDGRDANVLYGYGLLAAQDEKHGLGAYLVQHALKIFPDHAPSWVNLGICLKNLGRDLPALDAYTEALRIDPESPEALNAISAYYVNRGMPEKIIEYAERGLKFAPEHPHLHNHMALGLLELGRYDEAWPHYEYRWSLPERIKDRRPYTCPRWNGERVGTLAIHGEQGIGDEIFFMSCLTDVPCDRLVVECADRLVNLFEQSEIDACFFPTHEALIASAGEPDAYIAMGSLPGICGMPNRKPFMPRPKEVVPKRIGLAWRGGTQRTHKNTRTLKLEQFRPILDVPGYEFVSVQYGAVEKEAEAAGVKHFDVGMDVEAIQNVVASCEMVISVPQTAVHQAGAMGVKCICLAPKAISWQFAQASWYDSVEIWRQGDTEKWEPLIQRVAESLR